VERAGTLSGDELVAEMKRAGLGPERARAAADKAVAAAGGSAEPTKVVSLEERRKGRLRRASMWLGAASFIGYAAVDSLRGSGGVTAPNPHTEDEMRASDLRVEAFAACEQGNAPVCKAKLDEAKALDPHGEQRSEVAQARARIKQLEQRR
jgi:hypothetical protein